MTATIKQFPVRKSARKAKRESGAPSPTGYVELQVSTNFSFLRGASHPEELAVTAAALGHAAIAVADRNSLAGVVRAHIACKQAGIRLVVGARLDLTDGPSLLCFPTDRAAYGRLSKLLTIGRRRAPKGECHLTRADVAEARAGQIFVILPPEPASATDANPALDIDGAFARQLSAYRGILGDRLYLAAHHLYRGDDGRRMARLAALAERCRVPLVATNDVHCHAPERRPLQDVLTCIREHCTIRTAGWRLHANAERHLKAPAEMARLFRDHPQAVARTVEIADACQFSLDELRYEYPDEITQGGRSPQEELERLTWERAAERYPEGLTDRVRGQLRHELDLIGELDYAPYFLTVYDIVRFARSQKILCQGRGSAANSAVCYALGITAVDPTKADLLFERFVSAERNEPPDIDVDFEHERREEVIQYIYRKYGRNRAGMTATVICYRSRGSIREVGKAMGLSVDVVEKLSRTVWGWGGDGVETEHVRQAGLDPDDPLLRRALILARQIIGFPRHLSQHVGGFVISRGPLSELVPIENAAMEDRTVIEWDKDDLDALGILKVDVLGLGMLSCVRRGFDLLAQHYGTRYDLATLPSEDPAVYDMLCRADSVGVFQVESRAQMSMLPRLKPRAFYDLVIEVAIVRPGPIQGGMVHPYLRRRCGEESVDYPSEDLRQVLEKTLGVPLFQEQAMRIAIVAAGFTPGEADKLRRAMASFKRLGDIHLFRDKMIDGMLARGYDQDFAERCFKQIEGFSTYGFPESHAASFALLVYVSAWLKCYYPDVFACALLNSQPMGFYAPAQIVRDARDHGVAVRAPDVNLSDWDSTLESLAGSGLATESSLDPQPPSPSPSRYAGPSLSPRRGEPKAASKTPLPGEREGPTKWEGEGAPRCRPEFADQPVRSNHALRLGLRRIKGLKEEDAERLVAARAAGGDFRDPRDLWRRAGLNVAALDVLARADAFRSMGLDRRAAGWAVKALGPEPLPLFAAAEARGQTRSSEQPDRHSADLLPTMRIGEHVVEDYASLSLSLKRHPVALLRDGLAAAGFSPAEMVGRLQHGRRIAMAGLVLVRQRPGSANGVIFITLEDETGVTNLVIMPPVFEAFRREVMGARLLGASGRIERPTGNGHEVVHLKVDRLYNLSDRLGDLLEEAPAPRTERIVANSFDRHIAHADEIRRPIGDQRQVTLPKARSFR